MAYVSFSGWCELGGQKVTVQGLSSVSLFQKSFPNATQSGSGPSVTVYLAGTVTPATIYSDKTGTPLANPFPVSTVGFWEFFAATGSYDILFSGSGMNPFTISGVSAVDPTTPTFSSLILSGNGNGDTLLASMNGTTGHAANFSQNTSANTATVLITNSGSDYALEAGSAKIDGKTLITGNSSPLSVVAGASTNAITASMNGSAGHAGAFSQNTSGGTATVLVTNSGTDPAIYAGRTWLQGVNYIAVENGNNNAIACASGTGPALVPGLQLAIQLAHSLAANANITLNYLGGGALPIKSHFNPANNITTPYSANGTIMVIANNNNSIWLDMCQ